MPGDLDRANRAVSLQPPAKAAAEQMIVDDDLRGRQAGRLRGHRLDARDRLGPDPDFALTVAKVHRAVHRLHRGMGEEWKVVRRLNPGGGVCNGLVHVTDVLRHRARPEGCLLQFARDRVRGKAGMRAVEIARHVDGPVKVVWTREEDIQHDMYRPYWVDRIAAGLDASGRPVAWKNRFAGSSVIARWLPPAFKDGLDPDTTEGAIDLIYDLPNFHVEYVRVEPPGIQTAFWRSVGPSHNVFVTESFIDELAFAAGQDAVVYRRMLLEHHPRAKAVLDLAADKAGWGRPLPKSRGRGISVQSAFGSYLAQVAEVQVVADGTVRVHRVVCAMDCGVVVNPNTVQAQIQSGVIFGVTAALYGEVTLKNGRIEQSNFDSYQLLRLNEAPAIEVHVVLSSETPGGMGEAGTSGIVPAIANAVFAATGKRLRKMPIDAGALKQRT